jgi:hypothetical protein
MNGAGMSGSDMTDAECLGREMLHAIIKKGICGEHREDTLIGLGCAVLLLARTCREVDESGRFPSSTDLVIGCLIGKLESECEASWDEIEADLLGHGLELPATAADPGRASLQGEDMA